MCVFVCVNVYVIKKKCRGTKEPHMFQVANIILPYLPTRHLLHPYILP
jgi:hypothetical protein